MNRTAVLLSFLLIPTVLLRAQEPAVSVIHGRVLDAADDSGIESTDVYLLGDSIYGGRTVATESGGWFTFSDLTPGRYSARTYPDGYVASASVDVTLDSNGTREVTIRVQRLSATAALNGAVRDSHDNAIAGIKVCIEQKRFNEFGDTVFYTGPVAVCGETDGEGRYTIGNVAAGDYFLKAFPGGATSGLSPTYYPGVNDPRAAIPLVIGNRPETGVDILMERQPFSTVRGEVENVDGADTQVQVVVSRGGEQVSTTYATVIPGEKSRVFEIPNLAPGDYDISVVSDGAAASFSNIDSGLIATADGAKLFLSDRGISATGGSSTGFGHVDVRAEDVNGVRIVLDREPNIAATVLLPGQMPDSVVAPVTPVTSLLPEAQFKGNPVVLRTPTGLVTIPNLPTPPDSSKPFPALVCRNGHSVLSPFTSADNRAFTIHQVPRTECLLQVRNLPADDYVESAKLDGEDIWDRTFVPSPSASNLTVALADGGGRVSGRILDDRGEPFLATTTVVLVPILKPADHPSTDIRFQLAGGSFTLTGIRPGEYHVLAFAGSANSAPYYNNDLLRDYELRGAPVTVRDGGLVTADAVVIRLP